MLAHHGSRSWFKFTGDYLSLELQWPLAIPQKQLDPIRQTALETSDELTSEETSTRKLENGVIALKSALC